MSEQPEKELAAERKLAEDRQTDLGEVVRQGLEPPDPTEIALRAIQEELRSFVATRDSATPPNLARDATHYLGEANGSFWDVSADFQPERLMHERLAALSDSPAPALQDAPDDELQKLTALLFRSALDRLGSPDDHLAEIRKQLRSVLHVGA